MRVSVDPHTVEACEGDFEWVISVRARRLKRVGKVARHMSTTEYDIVLEGWTRLQRMKSTKPVLLKLSAACVFTCSAAWRRRCASLGWGLWHGGGAPFAHTHMPLAPSIESALGLSTRCGSHVCTVWNAQRSTAAVLQAAAHRNRSGWAAARARAAASARPLLTSPPMSCASRRAPALPSRGARSHHRLRVHQLGDGFDRSSGFEVDERRGGPHSS